MFVENPTVSYPVRWQVACEKFSCPPDAIELMERAYCNTPDRNCMENGDTSNRVFETLCMQHADADACTLRG